MASLSGTGLGGPLDPPQRPGGGLVDMMSLVAQRLTEGGTFTFPCFMAWIRTGTAASVPGPMFAGTGTATAAWPLWTR